MVSRSDPTTGTNRLRAVLRQQGVIRVRDLAVYGLRPIYLWRLCRQGEVIRVGRGLYVPVDFDFEPAHTVAEAAKRVPRGVVCLLTALRLHDLTTQNPHAVWLTIPHGAATPKLDYPPIEIVRASGQALVVGIEERVIEGITVRLYNPAKTVADCFKYRNKTGLDVAIEALRDCLAQRRANLDEIWRYAEICRVARVIRPYVEAIA
jgi:predicted transcriptional regulator of viral defense system